MTQIYLDIETTGNVDAIQFLPEPTPPRNYSKPESIARWMVQAKEKQAAKAALDLDAARIISIAAAEDDDAPEVWTLGADSRQDRLEEASILGAFWDWMSLGTQDVTVIGYNIRKFDLPILLRRTWRLGIAPPLSIAPMLNRGNSRVVDLMEALYHNGYTSTPYRGLKAVCQMCGIANPMPDVDGSSVDEMDAAELQAYNLNDIALTRALARLTKGYYWFANH